MARKVAVKTVEENDIDIMSVNPAAFIGMPPVADAQQARSPESIRTSLRRKFCKLLGPQQAAFARAFFAQFAKLRAVPETVQQPDSGRVISGIASVLKGTTDKNGKKKPDRILISVYDSKTNVSYIYAITLDPERTFQDYYDYFHGKYMIAGGWTVSSFCKPYLNEATGKISVSISSQLKVITMQRKYVDPTSGKVVETAMSSMEILLPGEDHSIWAEEANKYNPKTKDIKATAQHTADYVVKDDEGEVPF